MHKPCSNPKCGAPTKLIPQECPKQQDEIYQYRIIYEDESISGQWHHFNLYSNIRFSYGDINKIVMDAFENIKLYERSWDGCMCNQIWYSIKDYILDTDERFIRIREYTQQTRFAINEEKRTIKKI